MYRRPETLGEIMKIDSLKKVSLLGGGTDLVPLIKNGVKDCGSLIDITHIPEFRQIRKTENGWFIGASVTLSSLSENPDIGVLYPALAKAAAKTASPQIRSIGTIGGNILQDRRCMYFNQSAYWRSSLPLCYKTGGTICHQAPASPVCRAIYYSDTAPALCVYHAKALYYKGNLSKSLPVSDFIRQHTVLNGTAEPEDILLEGFLLPFPEQNMKSDFEKISIRNSIDFPVVNFAGSFIPGTQKACLYAGAVAPFPVRLEKTEKALVSPHPDLNNLTATAVEEIRSLSLLIKEPGISPRIKRESFQNIRYLFQDLL